MNGHIFEGEFAQGEINGYAVHTYPSGDRYEGMFKDGKRDGYGTQFRSDLTVEYEGEWHND